MAKKLIPERLIQARKLLGLSQKKASDICLINQGAYSRYESGERSPKPSIIAHIASKLNTTPEFLTGEKDNPDSTTITISHDSDPQLFEIVFAAKKGDFETAQRLLHYYKNL